MFHLLAQSTDAAGDAAAAAIVGGMFMVYFIVGIVAYVITALALMTIAKKLGKTEKSWWAWIPILNLLLLAELAGHEAWMGLICLVPVVGGFFALPLLQSVRGKEQTRLDGTPDAHSLCRLLRSALRRLRRLTQTRSRKEKEAMAVCHSLFRDCLALSRLSWCLAWESVPPAADPFPASPASAKSSSPSSGPK